MNDTPTTETSLLEIKVHKIVIKDGSSHCALCGISVPNRKKNKAGRKPWIDGEYVGVIKGLASKSMSVYRSGTYNMEALCDGTPASEFVQESDGSHKEDEE